MTFYIVRVYLVLAIIMQTQGCKIQVRELVYSEYTAEVPSVYIAPFIYATK